MSDATHGRPFGPVLPPDVSFGDLRFDLARMGEGIAFRAAMRPLEAFCATNGLDPERLRAGGLSAFGAFLWWYLAHLGGGGAPDEGGEKLLRLLHRVVPPFLPLVEPSESASTFVLDPADERLDAFLLALSAYATGIDFGVLLMALSWEEARRLREVMVLLAYEAHRAFGGPSHARGESLVEMDREGGFVETRPRVVPPAVLREDRRRVFEAVRHLGGEIPERLPHLRPLGVDLTARVPPLDGTTESVLRRLGSPAHAYEVRLYLPSGLALDVAIFAQRGADFAALEACFDESGGVVIPFPNLVRVLNRAGLSRVFLEVEENRLSILQALYVDHRFHGGRVDPAFEEHYRRGALAVLRGLADAPPGGHA